MRTVMFAGALGASLAVAAPAAAEDQILGVTVARELSIGAGVAAFGDEDVRDTLGTAFTWDARVGVGVRPSDRMPVPLGFEAAYLGSAQSIDALGVDEDAVLLGNGAEVAMRIGVPLGPVSPYLIGGVAWRDYRIVNTERNLSDVLDQDDVFELPTGVGIDFHGSGFVVDARAIYRPTFDDDLLATRAEGTDLYTLGARVSVGASF